MINLIIIINDYKLASILGKEGSSAMRRSANSVPLETMFMPIASPVVATNRMYRSRPLEFWYRPVWI